MGAIFGFSGPPDRDLLERQGQTLRHRGPRDTRFAEAAAGSLGYCAWAEDPALQRMGSGLHEEGHLAIALAGWATHDSADGDRPLLPRVLELYRRGGLDLVCGLRGAFVLALRDGDTLHLVRDGAGARTVYYGRHDGRFIFAVEPKGVLAFPGFPRRLRPTAVAQYLTFSFVPGAATMLEDLHELPAGHSVSWDAEGALDLRRYFVFEEDEPAEAESSGDQDQDEERWVTAFRDTFSQAVAERLPPGESVGVFLSGGIDSSAVAAEVAAQHDRPVKSFAIHFGERFPHELDFARAVAEQCGTDHEEVLVEPKHFLPRLRRIIWHLDDPIGDPISVPNFELAGRAARDVRWVFNGEGGDPLFGGPKNITMLLHHWYGGVDHGPNFRERAYLASYRRCYEELHPLLTPEFREQMDMDDGLDGVLQPFFATERPRLFLNKLMAINIRLKGAHLILPKVDRMLGAWGLTALAPLFDDRLVRLSFAMPARLKLNRGIEKVVIKRAFQGRLPQSVIDRPKSGMRVPVHFWFKKELKSYARKILSRRSIRRVGIFNERRVEQLLRYDELEGPGRYGLRLWMLITFEIWRRMVIEGEAP